MRITLPRPFSRHMRLLVAFMIAIGFAATQVIAQYGTFSSAYEGELWGVRHELLLPNGGEPRGMAYINGILYIADAANQTVVAYDSDGGIVAVPGAAWDDGADGQSPLAGFTPGEMVAVTVLKDTVPTAALLVSDVTAHRALAFDTAGAHLFTLQLERPGFVGAGGKVTAMAMGPAAQFVLTTGTTPTLALQGSFAAGWTNLWESEGVVLAYSGQAAISYNPSLDYFEPTPAAALAGTEAPGLTRPGEVSYGVLFDPAGNLYVHDTNAERLNVYLPDFSPDFRFGTPALDSTVEEFEQPYGIAYSPFDGGRLFIGDSDHYRVEIYRPNLAGNTLDYVSTIAAFGDGLPRSIAIDAGTGSMAVSDLASSRVWIMNRPALAAYDVKVLNATGEPIEDVCVGDSYQVQFSLTVPAGRLPVTTVVPTLSIAGVPVTATPTPGGAYADPMSAGDVAAYTYALTMTAATPIEGALLTAGATASTADVLFREAQLFGINCIGAPPSITAVPSVPPQVSGWTPVLPGETFELELQATDDAGVASIEYQITGQNNPGVTLPPVDNPTPGLSQTVVVPLPESGSSQVRYRATDTDGRKSPWQELDLRLQLITARASNEGDTVSFSIGSPVGSDYEFTATGLPHGATINAATGLISGQLEFDASGVYTVRVTESKVGFTPTWVEFEWTINNVNRHPTITPIAPQAAVEGQYFELQVQGYDPDGDDVIFTMNGLPDGIVIDPQSGLIYGTFPYWSERSYDAVSVGLGETQTNGLATLVTVQWLVADLNQEPMPIPPAAQANAEGDGVSLQIVASDPDDDTLSYAAMNLPDGLTINSVTGLISGTLTYASAGVHAVIVEVSDGINTPAPQVTFQWTVTDNNRAPVFSATLPDQAHNEGVGISLDIDASDDPGDTLTFSALSLPPGLSIDAATGVISGTLGYDAAGTYQVTITVTDGTTPASFQFRWTVADVNRPPTILALPDRSDAEGALVAVDVTGSDPDTGAVLTYSATGLPAGTVINAGTGDISGTIAFSAAGSHSVTVTVSDGIDTAAASFTWIVTAVNQPPTISSPNRISNEGDIVSVLITHEDLDGDPLTFTMTGLPPTHTISAAGVISGTFDFGSAGLHPVTVTVSDGTTTASTQFEWTVLNVNQPPTLAVEDQHSLEGQVIALQIAGGDPDHDALGYTMSGLPDGFAIEPATGIIRGTFDYDSAGTYNVTVGVWDGVLTAVESFVWTVDETNRAPVVDGLPNRTNAENDTVSIAVSASDPDGHTLSYSALNLPTGVTIDPGTGLISGTLAYDAAGTYVVEVRVFDGLATTTRTFTWTVSNVNRAPTASADDRTDAENATVSFGITSSDPDGDTLSYSATGLPAGISITPAGVISGTLGYATAGEYDVVVTVSDGSLSATAPFHWTVTNTNAPPTIATPGNQTNAEGDSVSVQIAATDEDGQALTFSATGLPPGLAIDSTGLITGSLNYTTAGTYPAVTVTVSDGVTTSSVTFTWTVTNVNRPPVVVNPGTQSSAEGATISLLISASDPDSDTLSYSATGLPPGLSINPSSGVIAGTLTYAAAGTYTVNVTASDASLSDSETFVWNVSNTNRPPTAEPDFATAVQGQSTIINVLGNDRDEDGVASLSVVSVTQPANGSVVINTNGTLTYTANATYVGNTTFSYTITDGVATSTTTVTVNVTPSNRPPVCSATASADDLWPPNHKPHYLSLTGITDPDAGDTITIRYTRILQDEPVDSVGQGNTPYFDGGIEANGARAWVRSERTGNPSIPGDGRVYLISYTATDEAGASCSGTTNLALPHDQRGTPAVLSPGRWDSLNGQLVYAPAPEAVNDTASVRSNRSIAIAVLGNDVLNGQPVVVTIVGAPSAGTATTDGQAITYQAPATKGTATLTYQVTGPFGTDTATVTITIT